LAPNHSGSASRLTSLGYTILTTETLMLKRGESIEVAEHIRIRGCRHGPMIYFVHDQYVGRSLDLYGEFSEIESAFLAQLIKPGMTIVEVGANIGAHTVALSRMANGGTVVAIEPQGEIFKLLCANLAMNGARNVIPIWAASGESAGRISIPAVDYTKPGNFGGISAGAAPGQAATMVTITPLDAIEGLTTIHALKVDVEGMELDVIRGAAGLIARSRPVLYVENDRNEKSPALIDHLLGIGYRCYWHVPPLFSAANYLGNATNVFGNTVSINLLCVPAEQRREVRGLVEVTNPNAKPQHYVNSPKSESDAGPNG
jgi:FkbM family methyltransferase